MGVETRRGSLYLYSARRVGCRVVKEYLGPLSGEDAQLVRHRTVLVSELRATQRIERAQVDAAGAAVIAALDPFDGIADRVFRAVMHLMGYRRHHRGDWRRSREGTPMDTPQNMLAAYGPKVPAPALFKAMAANPEHQRILDAAAAGDVSVLPAVRELLNDRDWLVSLGSVAQVAKQALIRQAAGDDVAVTEAVTQVLKEHVERFTAEDGPDPPFPIRLTALRVAHCWLAVHILETKSASSTIGSPFAVAVERQLVSAERRLAAALKSLAILRRINRPRVVTQVNVSTGPMVGANG